MRTRQEDDKFLAEIGYPPLSNEDFSCLEKLNARLELLKANGGLRSAEHENCLREFEAIYRAHYAKHPDHKTIENAARLAELPPRVPKSAPAAGPAKIEASPPPAALTPQPASAVSVQPASPASQPQVTSPDNKKPAPTAAARPNHRKIIGYFPEGTAVRQQTRTIGFFPAGTRIELVPAFKKPVIHHDGTGKR
jgi:hypothetical protein